jgi:hypothetical protein
MALHGLLSFLRTFSIMIAMNNAALRGGVFVCGGGR